MSNKLSKAEPLNIIITLPQPNAKGERADRVLSSLKGLPSRSQLQRWFKLGCICRGAETLEPSSRLAEGDRLTISPPDLAPSSLEPRELALEILFEDEDLIVLNKPKGLTVHPGASFDQRTTLVHGLLAHSKQKLSTRGGQERAGLVHRLDKDTEGLMVIAKTDEAHEDLSRQFSERLVEKDYWALCWGEFPRRMQIDSPLGRHPVDRKKMAIRPRGRAALTVVERIDFFSEGYSWVRCRLHTGRTHQIRVHLSSVKHPILGDSVYGGRRRSLEGGSPKKRQALEALRSQALVAFRIAFAHPRTQEKIVFERKVPEWMNVFLEK